MTHFSHAEMAGRVAGAVLTDRPLRLVTRRCACGGEITADLADPTDAVARHNASWPHLGWAWRAGLEEEWQEVMGR